MNAHYDCPKGLINLVGERSCQDASNSEMNFRPATRGGPSHREAVHRKRAELIRRRADVDNVVDCPLHPIAAGAMIRWDVVRVRRRVQGHHDVRR